MKILLLLTTTFPYDNGEEFISAELEQAFGFDQILICPCSLKRGSRRTKPIPQGAVCVPVPREPLGRRAYLRLLLCPCVWRELFRLFRTGRLSPGRAHELLFFLKNAVEIDRGLEKAVSVSPSDSVVLYSYWLYDAAAGGALFAESLRKRGVRVRQISRAHRFDIYSGMSKYGYLPMRKFLFRHIDRIFPCSDDGAGVLKREAGQFAGKIRRFYLGTKDCGTGKPGREPFHLMSCSNMVPVKRLNRIVEALRRADFPVLWTHIGSGPLEGEIRGLAEQLPPNVRAEFLGRRENPEILAYYKNTPVSVFVNVSSSEGLPVSIMEACSFGIPVVATDVGGTHEIVFDGENGFLIPADFSSQTLLDALNQLRSMDQAGYAALCANARKVWEEKFNAAENYREFYSQFSGSGI